MNERIRKLADNIWEEKYWTNPNTDKLLPAQLNKFAELIVRECMCVVEDAGGIDKYHYTRAISQHFGVKE